MNSERLKSDYLSYLVLPHRYGMPRATSFINSAVVETTPTNCQKTHNTVVYTVIITNVMLIEY